MLAAERNARPESVSEIAVVLERHTKGATARPTRDPAARRTRGSRAKGKGCWTFRGRARRERAVLEFLDSHDLHELGLRRSCTTPRSRGVPGGRRFQKWLDSLPRFGSNVPGGAPDFR